MSETAIDTLIEQLTGQQAEARAHLEKIDRALEGAQELKAALADVGTLPGPGHIGHLPLEAPSGETPPAVTNIGGPIGKAQGVPHSEREDGLFYNSPKLLDEIERVVAAADGPIARSAIFAAMTIEISPSTFMRSVRVLEEAERVEITGSGRGRRYCIPSVQAPPKAEAETAAPVESDEPAPEEPVVAQEEQTSPARDWYQPGEAATSHPPAAPTEPLPPRTELQDRICALLLLTNLSTKELAEELAQPVIRVDSACVALEVRGEIVRNGEAWDVVD